MLGKLSVPDKLADRLAEQGLAPAEHHAEDIRDFPELTRHDPFDWLLVAQASHDGL